MFSPLGVTAKQGQQLEGIPRRDKTWFFKAKIKIQETENIQASKAQGRIKIIKRK